MHNSPVYAGLTLFTIFEKKFNFRGKNVFSTLNFPLFSGTYSVIFDDGVEFESIPARMTTDDVEIGMKVQVRYRDGSFYQHEYYLNQVNLF